MSRTLLVIPCYNEALRLEKEVFLKSVQTFGFDLLFVNDGSKDGTLLELQELEAANPENIKV